MTPVTTTLKLKFFDLNQAKANMFGQTTAATTQLANELLLVPHAERKKLTTAQVVTPLKSALSNQVIRILKGKAGKRAKAFKVFWPEVNKQNWKVAKVGTTYSVSFPTVQGVKRVPIAVHPHFIDQLDDIINGDVEKGSLKLMQLRGVWYAMLSITRDVPEKKSTQRIGVDRGQNNLAVAATASGRCLFFSGVDVKHRRRRFQQLRRKLQAAGKYRAVKKLERRESRWMREVNHTISRRIVRFAQSQKADLYLEDLSNIRQTSKQRKMNRSDAGTSRHTWAYYDLETKLVYKMALAGRQVNKRPAAYTSKSDHRTGQLDGKRNGHTFTGANGYQCNADWNAAVNIAQWDGFSCPLILKEAASVMGVVASADGVFDNPLNSMNQSAQQLTLFPMSA
ncbi:Putative transposase DNA-binding domain family [Synechococcus sp. PCC 7335]|uniref:RNA-guided endonuclease TnpB family protein n=1 Tax=Synechococcus sp. (strain ATCC 29403 / PCC 7335) TaxID=91464 RepID=UPI00017EB1C5|nr:RNA-guided endonuclease TnpB family protein [Synechococcus sp. PCC 7335]EDX82564.1 Putative transposase DNA-binding domain family [Synechococcus sp. PCC 7335]